MNEMIGIEPPGNGSQSAPELPPPDEVTPTDDREHSMDARHSHDARQPADELANTEDSAPTELEAEEALIARAIGGAPELASPTNPPAAIEALRLQEQLKAARRELDRIVGMLTAAKLTASCDEAGWLAVDHLAVVAGWERYLTALIEGHAPATALDLDPLIVATGEQEPIEAIFRIQASDLPLHALLTLSSEAHTNLLAALGRLTDADLHREIMLPFGSPRPQTLDVQIIMLIDVVYTERRARLATLAG